MSVFYIQRPEASSGLKRTYHKKLEVFYGEMGAAITNSYTGHNRVNSFYATSVYRYNGKTKSWIEKPHVETFFGTYQAENVFSTPETRKIGFYTTLEAACLAKLLLIQEMEKKYKKALNDLEALFKRNVPDINKPLDQLLDKHPDLFI